MNLVQLRDEIDKINSEITDLLVRRMKIVAGVAAYKHENGLAVQNRGREEEILAIVQQQADEYASYAKTLFTTIIEMSKQNEYASFCKDTSPQEQHIKPVRTAACQGVAGAYSHKAAKLLYPDAEILFFPDWESVFTAVKNGQADAGVLPAENSSAGSVVEISELLIQYDFRIREACSIAIGHSLLAKTGTDIGTVKKVLSHPQALNQCRDYIMSKLPGAEVVSVSNTAEAARLVAGGEDGLAAISSGECAQLYGLTVLDKDIAPQNNRTRFFAVSSDSAVLPGSNKVSIQFSLPHVEGSLFKALVPFTCAGLNLTKLESRPFRGRDFEYRFFADFTGSLSDPAVRGVLEMFRQELPELVVLGNYKEHRF